MKKLTVHFSPFLFNFYDNFGKKYWKFENSSPYIRQLRPVYDLNYSLLYFIMGISVYLVCHYPGTWFSSSTLYGP